MKKILIASLIIPFILISCGKSEEVKSKIDLPTVQDQQTLIADSIIKKSIAEGNPITAISNTGDTNSQSGIANPIGSDNIFIKTIEKKFKEKGIEISYSLNSIDKNIDLDSFEPINNVFAKDKTNLYIYGEKIEGSDPATFEDIRDGYSRDKNNIYYNGYGNSFEKNETTKYFSLINTNGFTYGKDENSIYVQGIRVKGADPKTFSYYDGYAKDKNSLYLLQSYEGNRIFDIYRDADLTKYRNIDKDTFISLGDWYYKDKNNIYYIAGYNLYDTVGIIKGADVKTFQVLSDGYSRDKNNFYISGEKIEGNIYTDNEIRINLFENIKEYVDKTGKKTIMFGPLGPNLGPKESNEKFPIYELNFKEKLLENELIEQIKKKGLLISGPIKEKINGFDTIKWTAGGFCEERGIILLGVEKNYEFTSGGCSTEEKYDFNYIKRVIHTLEFLK